MKRRIFTLIIPYLLWNFFHTIYLNLVNAERINSEILDINIYYDIIQCNSSPHFWYIFMLIFWTALAPILYYAYKDKRAFGVLLILQLIYLIYKGETVLYSRYIYILYTWGGAIGFLEPDLLTKIGQWKHKSLISSIAAISYLILGIVITKIDIGMQFKVWIWGIKGVLLIIATINLPLLKIGNYTDYRYSFWVFAVHYWLDYAVSLRINMFGLNALLYQVLTWSIVVMLGLSGGIILEKICPKCFNMFTGNRGIRKQNEKITIES